MKVADLMTRDVRACTIHESLNAAARIMWEHDCGCVPVVDGHGKLAGIVTDRDICMAAYTQGLPLEAIPVERVMSAQVVSCSRGDDLETAHRLMRTHEIHRIPVADTRGRLIGILTLSDLLNHSRGDSGSRPRRSKSPRRFPLFTGGGSRPRMFHRRTEIRRRHANRRRRQRKLALAGKNHLPIFARRSSLEPWRLPLCACAEARALVELHNG